VAKDFTQLEWDAQLDDDCRHLVRLAIREDLDRGLDLTTIALVSDEATGHAVISARQRGVVAGLAACLVTLDEMEVQLNWNALVEDGSTVEPGQSVAELSGPARHMLTSERLLLNFLGRLSGIATLTRQFVETVAECKTEIYDTRKTTPGWRRLEKYAVRCGGGRNHRTGLFDAVLIKDNHLAQLSDVRSVSEAIVTARRFIQESIADEQRASATIVEVEVDSLNQLRDALQENPDIVLLDNMSNAQLREAVGIRDQTNAEVELEASGSVTLQTIKSIAETGVERISIGALTHSAISFDVGMDWKV